MLRALFLGLSENKPLRHFAEKSAVGRRMSSRFAAGLEVKDVIEAARRVNAMGATVSVDNLGENVTNPAEARESAQLYRNLLDEIQKDGLKANISLKLTHMGLDVDPQLCHQLVSELVAHAVAMDSFVRIDMEGSPYTQRTLEFVHELHRIP